jgi:hydrogenase/urease accessory protein HupE
MKHRLVLTLAAALFALNAHGHEFKMDALINAFVRIHGNEAHVVVRAPLFLFNSARFPVKNIELDVANAAAALDRSAFAITRSIVLYENGRAVSPASAHARLSLPSDRSFETYESAAAHVAQPPAADTQIYIDQGYVDAHMVYPIAAPDSVFSVRTLAARELGDYVKLALRYMPARGDERAMVISSRSGTIDLNPTWFGAAAGFVGLGVAHILTGIDHLLFLLCLLIPLRSWRPMAAIVTIFTIAHSFTLIGSAFGLAPSGAWFPPFVESAIAASIVYMALENIMGADLQRRLVITGLFGLVHGFGFSYGLQESFQFAGTHLLVSLFAFNVGIELGQLLALAMMLPLLAVVRRYVLRGRVGTIILSALAAQVGWNWMLERGEVFLNTPWPRPTLADAATVAFWILGILVAAGLITQAMRKLRLVDARGEIATVPP